LTISAPAEIPPGLFVSDASYDVRSSVQPRSGTLCGLLASAAVNECANLGHDLVFDEQRCVTLI
jgi:hypothetical protein